jgi:hypothetical protein
MNLYCLTSKKVKVIILIVNTKQKLNKIQYYREKKENDLQAVQQLSGRAS